MSDVTTTRGTDVYKPAMRLACRLKLSFELPSTVFKSSLQAPISQYV